MLEIGTLIDGKYKVLNIIGQGGMSVVYLAMNEKANKQWAIKEVKKEGVQNFEVVKQGLIVETDLLKDLSHPYLPSIIDVIDYQDTLLIVMDYIEGRPLSYVLEEEGAQPQEQVIKWGKQLCEVLEYLHTRTPAIIYRDMKPSNIMLKPDGNLVLIDFGTARKYKEEQLSDTTNLGTRGYAAPEQFAGANQRQSDERTDIYTLGATLYHLITNHNPCEPPYEMYPIRKWISGLSSGLEKIILKSIQKNPEDRYQSCTQLFYALDHYSEIDDKYRNQQLKKLRIFGLTAGLSILFAVTGFMGFRGILRQKMENYNYLLSLANSYVTASFSEGELDTEVINVYQQAINVDPGREEAYVQLLEYYVRMGEGQTQNGLRLLTTLISANKDEITFKDDLYMKIAHLYLNGNAKDSEFHINYANAYQFFAMVDSNAYPEAEYYKALSGSLSSMTVDWENVLVHLDTLKKSIANTNSKASIDMYLTIANVYRANAASLKEYIEEPFEMAIDDLLQAKKIVEDPYSDAGIREYYNPDILFGLADSSYRRANVMQVYGEDGGQLYSDAVQYYQELLTLTDSNDTIIIYKNRIGDIFRAKKEYENASKSYEELIETYPQDIRAYTSYALMSFIDLNHSDKALEIYNQLKSVNISLNDSNFQSLEIKLKNAGII